MNVFILSKEMPTMRLIQGVIQEIAGSRIDLKFFLEWEISKIKEIHSMEPIELLIWCVPDGAGMDENLIRFLKQNDNQPEIVFVFGKISEEWLRDMQKFCCQTFLMQPLMKNSITEILKDSIQRIEKKKRLKELESRNKMWNLHGKTIQQQFWSRFLNGYISLDPIDIIKEGESCGISLKLSDQFHLVMFSRQLVKPRNRKREMETREILLKAVEEYFSEREAEYYLVEVLRPFLVLKNMQEQELIEIMEDFVKIMGKKYDIPLCCYYDLNVYCEDIFSSAKAIVETEKDDVSEAPGIYRMIPGAETMSSTIPVIPVHAEEMMRNGQYIQFQQLIRSMILEQFKRGEVSGKYLKMLKMDVQQLIHVHLKNRELAGHLVMIPDEWKDINDNAHISVESFCSWMELICRLIPLNESKSSLVDSIRKWISENIREEITRELLAEKFYMSADYLGKLFKKETGESLGYFIMMEKLKEARRLLLSTNMMVGEISTELGYENFSYFSRIFNKYVGCTPREYRKKYLQGEIQKDECDEKGNK